VTDVILIKPGLTTSALAPIRWAVLDPEARLDEKMSDLPEHLVSGEVLHGRNPVGRSWSHG
jgi:hypothetical protein